MNSGATPRSHQPAGATPAAGQVKLAPSILTADFARIGEQACEAEAAGADWLHLDVMDGRFVPPITLGPVVVEAIRRSTALPLDVHLMIDEPERQIEAFARAGASILTVHVESTRHVHRVVQLVKQSGLRAGVAINPATPVVMLEEMLPEIDLALVMSVNPGWGGQPFLNLAIDKLRQVRRLIDEHGLACELEVDGGVKPENVAGVVAAGASVVVAGSAVYNDAETVAAACRRLREAITAGGMGSPRAPGP